MEDLFSKWAAYDTEAQEMKMKQRLLIGEQETCSQLENLNIISTNKNAY